MFSAVGAVDSLEELDKLGRLPKETVQGWRFHFGEAAGAEAVDFDDSGWKKVSVGHRWFQEDSTCWYRARLVIPEKINGISAMGRTVRLRLGVDNAAKAWVNGVFCQEFERSDGDVLLAESAQPGEEVVVALHCVNRPAYGSLYEAYLVIAECVGVG